MKLEELRTTGDPALDNARRRAVKAKSEVTVREELARNLKKRVLAGEITKEEGLKILSTKFYFD